MFRRVLTTLTLLAVAATALGADGDWVIREDGVGPAKIGMTVPELRKALHDRLIEDDDSGSDNCWYAKPGKHPHISFMILDGRFVRADVVVRGVSTMDGVQVGDSESAVRRRYSSKMTVEPHQYIDDGHYLTLQSTDRKYGIRFETEKGKITSFYAGRFSAIQYVEGCE
jgi:hypothetical protein